MKILRLLSLVGITAVALSPIAWAAPHGGGVGGFSGGGHPGGGGGGRAGFGGAPHFGGGGFGAPHANFGGVGNRGGGVGFGMHHPSSGVPRIATGPTRIRSSVPARSPSLQSSGGCSTRGLTNVGRGNRAGNGSGRATAGLNRPNNRGMNPANMRPGQIGAH